MTFSCLVSVQAPGGTGAEGEGVPAGFEADSPAEGARPGALQTEKPACSYECVILHYQRNSLPKNEHSLISYSSLCRSNP